MSGTIGALFQSMLGGGIPGSQPYGGLLGGGGGSKGGSGMVGSGERGMDRSVLREAFGNSRLFPDTPSPLSSAVAKTTPFRAAFNAGDVAGTYNDSPSASLPAPNQVNGRSISMLNIKAGGVNNTGNALFSGNPSYVYDGEDYVRYKKLKAINKTYNDSSFGGSNNGAYQSIKHARI